MDIEIFLEICGEFFDQIHPNIYDEDYLNQSQSILPNYNSNEELCDCNLCHVIRQISLFINPNLKTD